MCQVLRITRLRSRTKRPTNCQKMEEEIIKGSLESVNISFIKYVDFHIHGNIRKLGTKCLEKLLFLREIITFSEEATSNFLFRKNFVDKLPSKSFRNQTTTKHVGPTWKRKFCFWWQLYCLPSKSASSRSSPKFEHRGRSSIELHLTLQLKAFSAFCANLSKGVFDSCRT